MKNMKATQTLTDRNSQGKSRDYFEYNSNIELFLLKDAEVNESPSRGLRCTRLSGAVSAKSILLSLLLIPAHSVTNPPENACQQQDYGKY